jgi:hypothetical protein
VCVCAVYVCARVRACVFVSACVCVDLCLLPLLLSLLLVVRACSPLTCDVTGHVVVASLCAAWLYSGGLRHAVELVQLIRAEHGDYFCIAVAGYPEVHLEAWNSSHLPPSEQARCAARGVCVCMLLLLCVRCG